MGKKKGKTEATPEGYTMLTMEDIRAREIKYGHRLEALKHCMNYVEDVLVQLEELNDEIRLLENWLTYLSCDGLPKPYIPPDIRLFFLKLRHFEELSMKKNIDWTLSVDDRSILTQDIFRIDKTRETVKREKQPNFGLEYDNNINLALKVLKSIEYYLAEEKQYSQAKPSILKDIVEQKSSVHREICGFLDRCTYRILTSEAAYMENVDARTADYFYEGTSFQIHIWTVKNVPIRFEFLEDPFMIANLKCLGVSISIPLSILQDNLTVRGLHYDFDHFSEYAKSYDQIITIPVESLNAGIQDLRDCLANEWKMQVELQLETRNMLIQKRLEYDEIKRQIEEEEAQKAKDKKKEAKPEKQKKKTKDLKLPKETPILGENDVPDVWKDFLEREQKEFIDFLNHVYHPELLKLEPHELNLKKYLILGGIYQFDFVDKARHYDFNSFNMTWHENDGKLNFRNDLKIDAPERKDLVPNEADVEFDPNSSSPWFVISMTLPEYLCLWGTPMPCHFEADIIGYIEEEKEPEQSVIIHNKHKKSAVLVPSPPLTVSTVAPSTAPVSDQMTEDQSYVTTTLRNSVNNLNAMAGRRSSVMRLGASVIARYTNTSQLDLLGMGIEDFNLNFPLTKSEMRNLVRHCLPRIISSYKFPSEFTAEAKERSAKAKSAGGTLIRRHSLTQASVQTITTEKHETSFSITQQNNPERVFPKFPHPETLRVHGVITDNHPSEELHTFFDLIKNLDDVKRYYLGRPLRTANLPPFRPNMKLLLKDVSKQSKPRTTTPSRRSTRATLPAQHSTALMTRLTKESRKSSKVSSHKIEAGETEDNEEAQDELAEIKTEPAEVSPSRTSVVSVDSRKSFTFSRWTTKHIKHSEFDREKRKLTIWTDRLGVIGLAYKRYEHLPFRFWSLEPSEENPDNEVVFTLETQYAKVVLFITGDGVRGYVTDLQKKFVRNRPMYLVIDEPIKDFRELRKRFRDKNLNIFSERDASFYIENGYFSQKHLATELHTYCCMCTHAQIMRFLHSEWNRLSSRRNLVLRLVHHKESEDYMCTVRIQPEESTFVTVTELCSDDLDVFNLQYTLTWRNIDFYADLHHLITSMYPSAPEQRVKNPHLIYFLKAILWEIRPLSFS